MIVRETEKKTIIKWALWDTKGEEDLNLKQIQISVSNGRSKMLIPGTTQLRIIWTLFLVIWEKNIVQEMVQEHLALIFKRF